MNKKSNKLLLSVVSKKKVGKATQTSIKISMNDKTNVTSDHILQLINKFKKTGREVAVRGLNIERWATLKTMQTEYNPDKDRGSRQPLETLFLGAFY